MSALEVSCETMTSLITDYVEGALPADEHTSFEVHLVFCPDCLTYLGQMRATIRQLTELSRPELDPDDRRHLMQALTGAR